MKHVISHSSFRWCFAALATVVSVGLFAQDRYTVTVLPNDHSVLVQHEWNEVGKAGLVGEKGRKSSLYQFPTTVPGTYATLGYGRFIEDFAAYDASCCVTSAREITLGASRAPRYGFSTEC
jgi:hypothetical protein